MSYSVHARGTYEEILDKLDEVVADYLAKSESFFGHSEGMAEAVADHLDMAVSVVKTIVQPGDEFEHGVVVKPGQFVSVGISGHANPNHEPFGGWANDCLTISITQAVPESGERL